MAESYNLYFSAAGKKPSSSVVIIVVIDCRRQPVSQSRVKQPSVKSNNLESALLDVVRVQIGREFPVIDDSMRDVDMGQSEF